MATDYPWPVAEPFRVSALSAECSDDSALSAVRWLIDNITLSGSSVNYTFEALGSHVAIYTATALPSGDTVRAEARVMCKYVRREIRDLADEDRERFFMALKRVYDLSTSEGQGL